MLLQAPGVTQDSSSAGGIHVREQMGNVQYRINGIVLPEGATLFAQGGGLSPRLASSITLLTGALPAEYGLRTTGIFDIQTKSGAFDPGGYVSMYGGSHGWLQPSTEYRGSVGRLNYFVTGDYLENSIGISPATPNGAIHDDTQQGAPLRVLRVPAGCHQQDQRDRRRLRRPLPDSQPPGCGAGLHGQRRLAVRLDQAGRDPAEQNYFLVLSYLQDDADLSFQASVFAPLQLDAFRPDPLGDLLFNGIAQKVDRSSIATGLQVDGSVHRSRRAHAPRGGSIWPRRSRACRRPRGAAGDRRRADL